MATKAKTTTAKKTAVKKTTAAKTVKKAPVKKTVKAAKPAKTRKATAKTAIVKKTTKKSTAEIDFHTSSKEEIIKHFAQTEGDTGSPEVQIALLTQRILSLQAHLKGHKKDNHSRRGLLQMVGKRRRLLEYLKKSDAERHQAMLKAIELGK